MILHELFFASLGDESAPDGALRDALARDFGSVDRWRAEFSAMGKAQGGGSGWVLLTWSPHDGKLVNQWAMDHTTTLAGGRPILALDMYEHAYHIDYGAKAAAYVDAFMAAINWPNVARLRRAALVTAPDLAETPLSRYPPRRYRFAATDAALKASGPARGKHSELQRTCGRSDPAARDGFQEGHREARLKGGRPSHQLRRRMMKFNMRK